MATASRPTICRRTTSRTCGSTHICTRRRWPRSAAGRLNAVHRCDVALDPPAGSWMIVGVSPFDVFDPSAALDPTRYLGEAGAARLLQAAQHFPGGPTALVLALFFAPVGPGIPAGVLLARHVPLNPALTFGLYTMSDVLAAIVCHPLFVLLRRHGRKVKPIRWLGRRVLSLAMLGV